MKCQKCGYELNNNEKFCPNCGHVIKNEVETKIVEDATDNKVVDAEAKDVTNYVNSLKKKEKSVPLFFIIVFVLIFIAAFIISFKSGQYIKAGIALLQCVLIVICWLIKINVIKLKQIIGKSIFWLALILILPFFLIPNLKKYDSLYWPTTGIATLIPTPESSYGKVSYSETKLDATIQKVDLENFNGYINKCKQKGFTIDANTEQKKYEAFNEDGYRIELSYSYDEDDKQYYIDLYAPLQLEEIQWPSEGVITHLLLPESNLGLINSNDDDYLDVYVGDYTREDFNNYCKLLVDYGYEQNYYFKNNLMMANNSDGYEIRVEYYGYNIIEITLEAPEDTEEVKESALPNDTEQQVEEPLETIETSNENNESFREFLDEYEAFMNKYVDFMKKYEDSDDTASMLVDYTILMKEYAEFTEKMDSYDEDNLSDEDYYYYIEVQSRINAKLLEIE